MSSEYARMTLPTAPVTAPASRPGHLLNGRVYHEQPAAFYRTGIEPIILAASIPARSGQAVLEFGCGAGAALLCLAARVPGITGTGVEIQAELVVLARRNIAANRFSDRLSVVSGDALTETPASRVDHAFANPPWHGEFSSGSNHAGRDMARRARMGMLDAWTKAMAQRLCHRGTLTLILPSDHLQLGIASLVTSGCGAISLFPLWPKLGRPAKIIVLQGIYQAKGGSRVWPGLVLHEADGRFTDETSNILRSGAASKLATIGEK